MSGVTSSLELSEFFNNDDSEGQRLVEFLQKRRGEVKRNQYLFMHCDPQRLSFNVQLEKLPPAEKGLICKNTEENGENKETVESGNKDNRSDTTKVLLSAPNVSSSFKPHLIVEPASPILAAIPRNSFTQSEFQPPISSKPLSHSRLSSRFSHMRKSGGGVSPSDKLRRFSLKRVSRLCGGRRTLLQEFENTIENENFEPHICSTPLSQIQPDKLPSSLSSTQAREASNFAPNSLPKSPCTNESSCCGHTETLINTLQRKDEELKKYMNSVDKTLKQIHCNNVNNESAMDEIKKTKSHTTKSPLKRTYTVEKGNVSGQIILSPGKSFSEQLSPNSRLLRSQIETRQSKLLKTQEENSISKSSKIIEVSRSRGREQQQKMSPNPKTVDVEERNNNIQKNISIVFPTQGADVRKISDEQDIIKNSIVIQSGDMVVIPVNQVITRTGHAEDVNTKDKTKRATNNSHTLPPQPRQQESNEVNDVQCHKQVEDNLKLSDILTDDEEDATKISSSRTGRNDSQAPLNLAPNVINLRRKQLQKCSILLRTSQMDNANGLSTAIESGPPQAHSKGPVKRRKHIPLNKAPGIPLNGEIYAQELAQMSNYEIIDLRKRNSMGKIFAISGRRSRRSQEEAVKKQKHLDHEIEQELLRRDTSEIIEKQLAPNFRVNVEGEAEDNEAEYLPVPEEFRDCLAIKHNAQTASCDLSLINEKSSDRVSFKNSKSIQRLKRAGKKQVPEELKEYLKIPKKISQKKRKNSSNKSKRSLYSQSNVEEIPSSTQEDTLNERPSSSRVKKLSISYIPSPPKSDGEIIITPIVVSPPSPFTPALQKSTVHQNIEITTNEIEENSHYNTTDVNDNAVLPPPPPGFESDSNNINNQSTTNSTFLTPKTIVNHTNLNTNHHTDEDQIFKKPVQPAPRRRVGKRKENKSVTTDTQQCTSDFQESVNSIDSTDGTLRRSKRGQVPLKYPTPMFQILFQETLNRRLKYLEKQEQKEKQRKREISKVNRGKNRSKSIESVSSQASTKSTKSVRKKKQLATASENDPFIASPQQDVVIPNKKTPKVKKSKRKLEQNQNHEDVNWSNENAECSHLILTTPPPVDHLNNVFDQLRNTNSTLNSKSQTAPKPPCKIKSLKVCVARLKSLTPPIHCDSVSTISSTVNKNSNYELISWLKNITGSDCSTTRNEDIFKEMRISAASNLTFTELQGVEYAFYDTDDKASLGYLRFRPRQVKPRKRAKRFHLHFISLEGTFRITANDKESRIGVGDMVAIEKSIYYDIENLTDDIGILMVIKK